MRISVPVAIILIVAVSCGDTGDKSVAIRLSEEIALDFRDSLFVIKEGGMHFQITIPAEMMSHGTPLMSFNSATGVYHVRDAIQSIALEISPESRTWQEVVTQIQQNALFRIEWLESESKPNFAVYNRILPDGTQYDQMLVYMMESNSQRILVAPSPEGEYTESDIQKMTALLTTLKLLP